MSEEAAELMWVSWNRCQRRSGGEVRPERIATAEEEKVNTPISRMDTSTCCLDAVGNTRATSLGEHGENKGEKSING
jgi:hypothetical protein